MIGFFEEHGRFPHILKAKQTEEGLIVSFESSCESFVIEDVSAEEVEELLGYISDY